MAVAAHPQPWSVTLGVGRIRYPGLRLDDLELRLGAGSADLDIGLLALGGASLRKLKLHCAVFAWRAEQAHCQRGLLRGPAPLDRARIAFALSPDGQRGRLTMDLAEGGHLAAELAAGDLRVQINKFDPKLLKPWLPDLAVFNPGGTLDCTLRLPLDPGPTPAEAACTLRQGAFASADGLQAGEALALDLTASAQATADGWRWEARLDWREGALYVHPIYVPAGAKLSAQGVVAGDRIRVERAALAMAGVGTVQGRADVALRPFAIGDAEIAVAAEDLAVFGARFLAPLLMPAQADKLTFGGRAEATVTLAGGRPTALAVQLDRARIEHAGFELGLGPVTGAAVWHDGGTGAVRLDVGGGRWQALEFGAFGFAARVEPGTVTLAPMVVPVLDGNLRLDDLALRRDAGGWYGEGRAAIDPIAMPRLSAALGLPVMGGSLSAALPRLRVRPGEIAADGEIAIDLFAGRVAISDLRLIEPFGVGAYARAEMKAQGIDLGMLTRSFDFGSISGRVDAQVRGLELVHWRPVAFDAQVASSPGRYRRRISQRALQSIGALGGAGVVNAIQRSALRFFDSFGYRRIGLSCVLKNGVCRMDGIESGRARPDGGFLIIQGGGVPALDVVGYNRRIDWDELLTRLGRVTKVEAAPVVE
ncbi:MAG: hypothetical protein EPO03_04770 [Porticoccaceae bacterium]|nr:MAG: hypothetical protein EPO03_04770 [Porticoccaceae bacterium]